MDFLTKVEIELFVVRWWYTHQNEAKVLKLASPRKNLSYRAPWRAPRAISIPKWNFRDIFTMWTFWEIGCAWCPHYKMKMLRSKKCVQCRHFDGYATFIRFLGKILVNYENQQKSAFSKVFHCSKFWARARKIAILGLPEVWMSAELGLHVITWKFWHA